MNIEEIERISEVFNETGYYGASYDASEDLGIIDEVTVAFQDLIALPASLLVAYESLFLALQPLGYMDQATQLMPTVQVRVTEIEEVKWTGGFRISFTFYFVFAQPPGFEGVEISGILTSAFGLVVTVASDNAMLRSTSRKQKKRQQPTAKLSKPSSNRQKRKVA